MFTKLELATSPIVHSVHKLSSSLFIRYNNYVEDILNKLYEKIGGNLEDYRIIYKQESPLDFAIVYSGVTIARIKVTLKGDEYTMIIEALDPKEVACLDTR